MDQLSDDTTQHDFAFDSDSDMSSQQDDNNFIPLKDSRPGGSEQYKASLN